MNHTVCSSEWRVLLCMLVLLFAGYCPGVQPDEGEPESRYPEFSWDTVPRYMHVRKATAFSPDEIEYLAKFPLITFEKTTGLRDAGSTEKGTLRAAKAVKALNPQTKILYYRNIIVHYSCYDADQALKTIPGAVLADAKGNTKLVRGQVPAYDLSNPKIQSWWLESAKSVCDSEYIDGLFVDGNIKALEPVYLKGQIGVQKKSAVAEGYHKIMKEISGVVGPDGLVVANILRARFPKAGLEYMDYFDGSYIECFESTVGKMSREEYVAKGIEAIQKAAGQGKIIAFTMGMGDLKQTEMGIDEARVKISDNEQLRKRFNYALGVFLICAGKYSYFLPHDGYGVDNGSNRLWMKEMPELSRPLGAPKGPAVRTGWEYRREFEHVSVMVDIEKEVAQLEWK